jgi:hypothetical protein
MQLQVELYSNLGVREVFWLNTTCVSNCDHNNCQTRTPFQQGRRIILVEEPYLSWTVLRTFVGLGDNSVLPIKAQKRTLGRFLEEDGSPDVKKVFPQLFPGSDEGLK